MRKLPGLVAVAVTLAGCGTTVPLGAQQQAAGAEGLQAPNAQTPTSNDDSSGGTRVAQGTPVSTPGAVLPTGPAALPTSTPTSDVGVTASLQPVKVGFVVASNSTDAAFKAAGVGALQVGNQRAQAQAVVNDINAHGGLAGRRIVPVFNEPDASAPSYDAADQEQCDAFTTDEHVAFVISVLAHTQVLHRCLAQRGVPLLDDVLYQYDSKVVVPGLLFMPSSWLLDRLMRNQIDALARIGFLDGSSKVGVLLYDVPASQRVLKDVVLPRLAHYGKTDVDVAASPFTTEGASNQLGNVLKFSRDGVNRVIELAFNPIGFMEAAEAQQYHPRYALDSSVGPETIRQALGAAADQLNGMGGVGWIPSSDTGSGAPVTPSAQRCLALMKKAGLDTSNSTTAGLMEAFCDAGWFLQAATTGAGDAGASGLLRGARLTKGYVSASSFGADMTSGRPDGLSAYRDLAYKPECSCIQYVGGLRAAS